MVCVVDANGNITLNFNTCSGTAVKSSYTASAASAAPARTMDVRSMLFLERNKMLKTSIQTLQ